MTSSIETPQAIYEASSARGHARLSASAAYRWLVCPGSVKAQENLPPEGRKEAADKGTAAHALVEWGLLQSLAQGRMVTVDPIVCGCEKVGGWPVSDLAFAVNEAIEWAWNLYESLLDPEMLLEVDLPSLQDFHPDLGGTCDIIIKDRATMRMWVIDYKNGRGEVLAKENPQLGIYAFGAEDSESYQITLVILQPNTNGPLESEWGCPQPWLGALMADVLKAADLSNQDDPPRCYDKKACHWCRDVTCPLRLKDFDLALPQEIKPVLDVRACDLATLGAIKDKQADIEAFLKAVNTEITNRLAAGADPEELGYKQIQGEGRSTYDEGDQDALDALAAGLLKAGVEPYEKPKLIGITKARKALGKKGEHLVDAAVYRPLGKPKLVPVSDARPAIDNCKFDIVKD